MIHSLLPFFCGVLFGIGVCWFRLRNYRNTLNRLEQLLPESLQRELTSLPYRLQRWVKTQEEQLLIAEGQLNTYESLLDQLPFGFLQVDQNNQLIFWNSKALDLLQIENLDPLEQGDRLVLELVRSYELDRLIAKTRRKQKPCKKDWVLKSVPRDLDSPDLTESSQSLRGYGIPLTAFHVGVFLEDRSKLDALKQDRDRWTSDVAHEFKTPLTAIRLVSETLELKVEPDLRPWVVRLQSEVLRLTALVQDILDLNYGQGNVSQKKTPKQTFDLAEQIQAAWLSLEPIAEKKDLSLFYDGPDRLKLQGDSSGLYRVFLNLLDNAVKHSPERETILLKARKFEAGYPAEALELDPALVNVAPKKFTPRKTWIQIDVMDMGAGIPKDALPHVFKRFFKVDQSRVRNQEMLTSSNDSTIREFAMDSTVKYMDTMQSGTGLGLAIAHEIVLAHQGQIAVGNHPEWQGAWFQVRLPRTQKNSKKNK